MRARRRRDTLQFAGWVVVGVGAVTAVLTILSIGFFVLLVTAALAAVLARRAGPRFAAPGLLVGAGLMPCYVAYLNRSGPGMVCMTTRTGTSCGQEMSPWPWVAAGLCLIGVGAAIGVLARGPGR